MLTMIQDTHSHEEESNFWPQIEAKMPGAMASFQFDHDGERKYVAEVKSALEQLQQGSGDKQDAAKRLYRNTVALSSHLIHHMAKEEAQPYSQFADAISPEEETQIIHGVYEALPAEVLGQAMPWWASYQTPEGIVDETDTMIRAASPEKARLVVSTIIKSLPPEKWSEVEKLRPELAQYRQG